MRYVAFARLRAKPTATDPRVFEGVDHSAQLASQLADPGRFVAVLRNFIKADT